MGAVAGIRDVIVVGMGPGGAGATTMLRAPKAFGIIGEALDVLALEARGQAPSAKRVRAVILHDDARRLLGKADDLVGRSGADATAYDGVATISGIERSLRATARFTDADVRYGARIAGVEDHGHAGVQVLMDDGSVHRGRYLIDATGGRLGPFRHGAPEGETVYLTGNLPPMEGAPGIFRGDRFRVHGAGNDREWTSLFGFNDAREGATAFVQYPSVPARGNDAGHARQLLRRYLRESGISPGGLTRAQFIVTPHVQVPNAVAGSMLAIGDSVRRVSPRSGAGVSNALLDARGAAFAIQETLTGARPQAEAFEGYAIAASRRGLW